MMIVQIVAASVVLGLPGRVFTNHVATCHRGACDYYILSIVICACAHDLIDVPAALRMNHTVLYDVCIAKENEEAAQSKQ